MRAFDHHCLLCFFRGMTTSVTYRKHMQIMDRHLIPCRPYLQYTSDDPCNEKMGKRTARNERPPCSSSPSTPQHNLVKRTGSATLGNRRSTAGTIQTPNTRSFTKKRRKKANELQRLSTDYHPLFSLINAQK